MKRSRMVMMMTRETLTLRHKQSIILTPCISRKKSPSLPSANSSNRGDQGSLAEVLLSIKSVLIQSAGLPAPVGSAPYELSYKRNRTQPNSVFNTCMPIFLLSSPPPSVLSSFITN